ncbi:SusC/RagA family TonB-linked outer membrane protein [Pedobacter hiemivivus]|nr:SusC/RagA family TonB-linked outer membrane protein [Pedobacter hiemivivus]
MKLIFFIITIACVQVSAIGYSQNVNIQKKDAILTTVFSTIEKQTGYSFFWKNEDLTKIKVDVKLQNASLEDALKEVFKGLPLTYSIVKKSIVVQAKAPSLIDQVVAVFAGVDIFGVVVDAQNNSLAGATITVKDGKRSTTTGAGGQFTLKNIPEDAILQISFMGYITKEVKANSNLLGVKLELSTSKLDEVQVMAYGKTNKRLSTGNIVTVTAAEIEKQPVQNPLMALQGRVPGLIVSQVSGYAGSPVKIEIRGRQSISTDFVSDPLYIIDGVPMNNLEVGGLSDYQRGSQGVVQNGYSPSGGQSPFYNINPRDIESIEVLKDADATAIYGSRGARGVILITTKKGKPGATKFAVNVDQGFSTVTQRWNMLNTQQYLEVRRAALKNDNITPDVFNAPDLMLWDTTKYTDWQKKLWGNVGRQTKAAINLSGGDVQTQFTLSGNYGKSTEILTSKGNNQGGGLSFNLGHTNLNRKFKMDLSTMYSFTAVNNTMTPSVVTLAPNAPDIYNENGLLNYEPWSKADMSNNFPFGALEVPSYSGTHFLNSSLNISYAILNSLSISTRVGYQKNINTNKAYSTIISQDPALNPRGGAFIGTTNTYNMIVEPQINYNSKLGPGQLSTMLGGSFQKTATSSIRTVGAGYESDDLLESISLAPFTDTKENQAFYKYAAVFGRINYDIEGGKYILSLNGRRDGSSRFAPGTQFGNFGSVAAAWTLSKEDWFKNIIPPFVSFMKLRGSYGLTGSDVIGDYQYLTRWTKGLVDYALLPDYDGNTPIISTQAVNQQYRWQVTKKMEVALSMSFLEDKITMETALYRDRCGNQLTKYPTPVYTGFPMVQANWPALIENSGWEISITANVMRTDKINWNWRFNGSRNFNKLLGYPDIEHSPYADKYKVGESVNNLYLYHYTGINPLTGRYTFEDYNQNGRLDDRTGVPGTGLDDRYVRLDMTPRFNGGIGTDFSYSNLSISFFFDYRNQMGTKPGLSPGTGIGGMLNLPSDVIGNYWKQPGDQTKYPKPTTLQDENFGRYANSDAIYENCSYIRLSNVAFSYAFDQKFVKKLGAESLRMNMSAQNIFLISSSKGMDPDIQFGALPPARTILLGLSLNF